MNKVLLFITSALFLIYLLVIFSCVRPISDDLNLLLLLKNNGVAGSLVTLFNEWSFRWAPLLCYNVMFVSAPSFTLLPAYIFIFYLITIFLFMITVFYFLKRFLPVPTEILLCYAVISVAVIYFFTFQGSEVWFWVIASFAYLVTFILTFLGFSVLLNKEKSWTQYGVLIACFTFIGGSVEHHAVTVLILLGLTALFAIHRKNRFAFTVFSAINKTKIFIAAGVLVASLIFNLSGRGIDKRLSSEMAREYEMSGQNTVKSQKVQMTESIIYNISAAVMQRKNITGLLLALSWMWLGRYYREKHPGHIFPLKKIVVSIVVLMGMICLTTVLPLVFVFGNSGFLRAWSPISFFGSLASCIIFFLAGNHLKNVGILSGKWLAVLLLITDIALCAFIYRHLPAVKKFSRAYDNRCEYLISLEKKGNTSVVAIDPLPTDNPLPVGDLSVDENNSDNKTFCKLLGLHFPVKVKDENRMIEKSGGTH